MHQRYVNHCILDLNISPSGPLLIKSGKQGADPTKPYMEFVDTYYQGRRSIYLPGSSLKGAIRAHAERIVRTVGSDKRPTNGQGIWANDPIKDNHEYPSKKSAPEIYKLSCFTDQMFGSTEIASRVRIEDAYPINFQQLKIEERNGVAIDRVFGSVAVGPFNYEVCTAGEFRTKIHLKNFTLAQLGLIALVLRDLDDGWFGLGYAKSRGMGLVKVAFNQAVVQYPGCILDNEQIKSIGANRQWDKTMLLGAGEFLDTDEANKYGFYQPDRQPTPVAGSLMEFGFGVKLTWSGAEQVKDLFIRSVKAWSKVLGVTA